jgi:hypothetical protein
MLMKKPCRSLAILSLLLLLFSCAPAKIDLDVPDRAVIRIEEIVERSWKPQIYVQPEDSPQRPLTAIVFPFKMRQAMKSPVHYGREIARVFWEVWLKQRVFSVMEFSENSPWQSAESGIAAARAKGADLAIGGEITHMLAGGDMGNSQLSVRIEIYDTASGALIWSISHAGILFNRGTKDWIFFTVKSRMPNDPLYAISFALALDISKSLNKWMEPIKEEMEREKECRDCPPKNQKQIQQQPQQQQPR